MISLLITILVLVIVFALVWWVLQQLPLPAPFDNIVRVVVVVIFCLVLINLLMGISGTGLHLGGMTAPGTIVLV